MLMLAFALLASAAVPASQSLPDNEHDVRCVIAASQLRVAPGASETQTSMMMALMSFYTGRLSATLAPKQIEAMFNTTFPKVKPSDYQAIVQECVPEMLRLSGAA